MSTVKIAEMMGKMAGASVGAEYLLGLPGDYLTMGIPSQVGGIAGQVLPDEDKEKYIDMVQNQTQAASLIPGVGAYRLNRRVRASGNESRRRGARHVTGNRTGEFWGPLTSTALAAGAGALGGAALPSAFGRTDDRIAGGAAVGAGVAGAATLAALVAAAVRKRRTDEEQATHDDSGGNAAASWALPGVGAYNVLKRLGQTRSWDEEADTREEQAQEKRRKQVASAEQGR